MSKIRMMDAQGREDAESFRSRQLAATRQPHQEVIPDPRASRHQYGYPDYAEMQRPANNLGHYQGQQVPGLGINVNTNHNIHLSFKEWMLRGVVGGVGSVLAFPFRLVGEMLRALGEGLIKIVTALVLILLVPTFIWLGIMLKEEMSTYDNVEDGTAAMVDHAGEFADGVGKGLSK